MELDKKLHAWQIKMGKMSVEFMISPFYKYLMETYDVQPNVWFMNESEEYTVPAVNISISIGDVHFSFTKFFANDEGDDYIMLSCNCYKLNNYQFEDFCNVKHFRLDDIETFIMMEMADIDELKKNNEKNAAEVK